MIRCIYKNLYFCFCGAEKVKSKEPAKETNFIRQNVLRCSYRPKIVKKTETKSEYVKFILNLHCSSKILKCLQWIALNVKNDTWKEFHGRVIYLRLLECEWDTFENDSMSHIALIQFWNFVAWVVVKLMTLEENSCYCYSRWKNVSHSFLALCELLDYNEWVKISTADGD